MNITTLKELFLEHGIKEADLNLLFKSRSLTLIEQTIAYLERNEGCGIDTYRNPLDNGTFTECCEHISDFYTDRYISLVIINTIKSLKEGKGVPSIKDCIFYQYEVVVKNNNYNNDQLSVIDYSAVTLKFGDRSYFIDYQNSSRYADEDDNNVYIDVGCASLEDSKEEAFEDINYDLTFEDLGKENLEVTLDVWSGDILIDEEIIFVSGSLSIALNNQTTHIPITQEKEPEQSLLIDKAIYLATCAFEDKLLVHINQQCNDNSSCYDCIALSLTDGEYNDDYEKIIEALEKEFDDKIL